MSDKEVGELWRKRCARIYSHDATQDPPTLAELEFDGLIRKLVEERANWYRRLPHNAEMSVETAIKHVLRDFGIDPEEWK
jgi:hypothetical protein